MNPTQYELATLAATQSGAPLDRARAALALWNACGEILVRETAIAASVDEREFRRREALVLLGDGETVTLDAFLKAAMPQSKSEDRAKMHREWVRGSLAYHEKYEGEKLEATTANAIARLKSEGYPAGVAVDLLGSFQNFIARDRSEKNTARAKKGAAAKKSLGTLPKAKKTPQAKRKPRQANR